MKESITLHEIQEHIETEPILKVVGGKIFVEGVETTDDELIGIAFKDFAEKLHEKGMNFDSGLIYAQEMYGQDYADKQREADEIVNDIEDSF